MTIKNIETRLNKMSISNIQNICKKMKVKYIGKSKQKMIQELMLPIKMKYRMKRKMSTTNNTKCHNDKDFLLYEFYKGKYVNFGRYCVSEISCVYLSFSGEFGHTSYRILYSNQIFRSSKKFRDIHFKAVNELLCRF